MNHLNHTSKTYFRAATALMIVMGLSAQSIAQDRFVFLNDGTEVLDQFTNLIWKRCVEGKSWDGNSCVDEARLFTYKQAITQNSIAFRLPNIKELATLVDTRLRNPAIYTPAFPNTTPVRSWSKTVRAGDATRAWSVDFQDGMVTAHDCTSRLTVRLVRSSPLNRN